MTRVAFITDGGQEMGMGHVMRSLTFAQEISQSCEVFFVTSSEAPVQEFIKSKGYGIIFADGLDSTIQAISEVGANVVIIDRVFVEEELAKKIKLIMNCKVAVMDSASEANRWADIVVNGLLSKFRNESHFDEDTNTQYYSGPKYLILKPDFDGLKRSESVNPLDARSILIIFGGSDPNNLTCLTLRGLLGMKDRTFDIDIVMGPKFGFKREVLQAIDDFSAQERVTVHENVGNVAELMWKNELVFTAPGLAMFEALAVGLGVVVAPQNELQRTVYDYLFTNYDKVPGDYSFYGESFMLLPSDPLVQSMEIGEGRTEVIKAITDC